MTLKWDRVPVRWFATDRGVPGVSASAFQAAIARAFATWEAVPTASIAFQFVGFTGAEPFEDDDLSVLGFQNEPDMERVLGATGFVDRHADRRDRRIRRVLQLHVPSGPRRPRATARGSISSRWPSHEIGHFVGLGHSALGETELRPDGGRRVLGTGAVMFPIAFGRGSTAGSVLQPDDIAGVSDLYPDGDFRQRTGVARGRVVRNGAGVLGAHVVAFNPETGALIGGFSVNRDGEFQIAGLSPGPHVIRVEPLDDADVDSFFGGSDPVDVNFGVTFHDRLFVAPAGGAGERFIVTVRPK